MIDETGSCTPQDIEATKWVSLLAYIGPLFLIPLFLYKNSPFARFHANQGLVLFVAWAVVGTAARFVEWILHFIPIINWFSWIVTLVNVPFAILAVLGVVWTISGKARRLPLLGTINILK